MQYREFGKTPFKVSALGMGCMRLPTMKFMPLAVNYKKTIRMIRRAIDLGVNYFDTGYPYHLGQSEKVLGIALQDGYREKVHLVTKLPMFLVNKSEDFDRLLNEQLGKLKTGHLDTYLFHGLSESGLKKIIEFKLIEKMEQAKKDGRIQYIGFSFHDTLPVFKTIIDYYPWDVAQIQYNYLDTTLQATTEGLEYAYSKNIAVIIMEPLKGGLLAKPPKEALDLLKSSPVQKSPVEWALQYLWNKKEVAVVLSGMSSLKMVEENCQYAGKSSINMLSPEDNQLLENIVRIYKNEILVPCTACRYCMPCSFGVNIPENFAIINAANTKSNSIIDSVFKLVTKGKYKRLTGDKAKLTPDNPNGNASICTECGKCVPKCPQSIQIPAELKKVHAVLGLKRKIREVYKER